MLELKMAFAGTPSARLGTAGVQTGSRRFMPLLVLAGLAFLAVNVEASEQQPVATVTDVVDALPEVPTAADDVLDAVPEEQEQSAEPSQGKKNTVLSTGTKVIAAGTLLASLLLFLTAFSVVNARKLAGRNKELETLVKALSKNTHELLTDLRETTIIESNQLTKEFRTILDRFQHKMVVRFQEEEDLYEDMQRHTEDKNITAALETMDKLRTKLDQILITEDEWWNREPKPEPKEEETSDSDSDSSDSSVEWSDSWQRGEGFWTPHPDAGDEGAQGPKKPSPPKPKKGEIELHKVPWHLVEDWEKWENHWHKTHKQLPNGKWVRTVPKKATDPKRPDIEGKKKKPTPFPVKNKYYDPREYGRKPEDDW